MRSYPFSWGRVKVLFRAPQDESYQADLVVPELERSLSFHWQGRPNQLPSFVLLGACGAASDSRSASYYFNFVVYWLTLICLSFREVLLRDLNHLELPPDFILFY